MAQYTVVKTFDRNQRVIFGVLPMRAVTTIQLAPGHGDGSADVSVLPCRCCGSDGRDSAAAYRFACVSFFVLCVRSFFIHSFFTRFSPVKFEIYVRKCSVAAVGEVERTVAAAAVSITIAVLRVRSRLVILC